jgi:DNA primase
MKRHDRFDMERLRPLIDIEAVATAELREPPAKRSGRRLYWPCPFHRPDRNPSFQVDPARRRWTCWPCGGPRGGASGDAIELVQRVRGVRFVEAVRIACEHCGIAVPELAPARTTRTGPTARPDKPDRPPVGPVRRAVATAAGPPVRAAERPPERRKGLPPADALALVTEAKQRLWEPEGTDALAYLTERRGLAHETILAAHLGWTPRAHGAPWSPPGWVIPWFDGDRLALVKIRVPNDWREAFPDDADHRRPPKYIEAFRDRPPVLFPGPEAIRPGTPLIVVEGEFEQLLMHQEVGDWASVVTTGSSANLPDDAARRAMRQCPVRYLALDADVGGDKGAAKWIGKDWVRVRPPAPAKDWGELHAMACNAIRYLWGGILRRPGTPWDELAAERWGTGQTIEGPGFETNRIVWPASSWHPPDDDDRAEREAIREHGGG